MMRLGNELPELLETDFPVASEYLQRRIAAYGGPLHAATLLLAARASGSRPHERIRAAAVAVELLVRFPALLLRVRDGDSSIDHELDNTLAVLIADFAVARSLRPLSTASLPVAQRAAGLACSMSEGAALELEDRGNHERSVSSYLMAVERMDGRAFAFAARAGAELASAPTQEAATLEGFGHYLGMAFAISTDIQCLVVGDPLAGDPPGAALVEGRYGLPVIYALAADRKLGLLLGKPPSRATAPAIVSAIAATGAVELARLRCRKYASQASAVLDGLAGPTEGLRALANLAVELAECHI